MSTNWSKNTPLVQCNVDLKTDKAQKCFVLWTKMPSTNEKNHFLNKNPCRPFLILFTPSLACFILFSICQPALPFHTTHAINTFSKQHELHSRRPKKKLKLSAIIENNSSNHSRQRFVDCVIAWFTHSCRGSLTSSIIKHSNDQKVPFIHSILKRILQEIKGFKNLKASLTPSLNPSSFIHSFEAPCFWCLQKSLLTHARTSFVKLIDHSNGQWSLSAIWPLLNMFARVTILWWCECFTEGVFEKLLTQHFNCVLSCSTVRFHTCFIAWFIKKF